MRNDAIELVTLRTFLNHIDADLAKSALDAAQIDSVISADDAGGLRPGLWVGEGVRLLVRREDYQLAAEVLDSPTKNVSEAE